MDERNKNHTLRRILPAIMSTKIMIQLHKKYNKPTKQDFDYAIAELFNNASNTVSDLNGTGKNPSYDLNFWRGPKVGTIFEKVSDKTTYRFAVKVLEARDRWVDRERAREAARKLARQRAGQAPSHDAARNEAAKYESEAAKAIDRFKANAEVAALASGGVADLMNAVFTEPIDFTMSSYMIDQFKQLSDTEDEALSDDEGPRPRPAQPRASKRGMLEVTGTADRDIEAPTAKRVKLQKTGTTDSGFDPALVSGTAKMTLAGGEPEGSKGAKENNTNDTGDFRAFLAQLAKEDQAQLDEEDMMEMDGY